MFRGLGNLHFNPSIGMLFIDFEQPQRLRVLGHAKAAEDDELLATWPGA
jgi:hypothetical protein